MKPLQTQIAKLLWPGAKRCQDESLKRDDVKVKEGELTTEESWMMAGTTFPMYLFISQEIIKFKLLFPDPDWMKNQLSFCSGL